VAHICNLVAEFNGLVSKGAGLLAGPFLSPSPEGKIVQPALRIENF
jgi:hypothetical protein